MLTTNVIDSIKNCMDLLQKKLDSLENLIIEEEIKDDRIFFSNLHDNNLKNTFKSIYYDINVNIVVSEGIK